MKLTILANRLMIVFCLVLLTSPIAVAEEIAETTHDGLVLMRDSKVAVVYVDPEADFSQYTKIQILDVYVAFKKHWQRKHSVSKRDMER